MGKGRTWRKRVRRNQRTKESLSCQTKYISLRKWMKAEGNFKCPKLIPYIFSETGRGLMTLKPLKPGDLLLSVSDKLIITSATVLSSDIGHWIKKCEPPLSAHQVLAIFLLNERAKGPQSFWYPYLRLLPDKFDTPVFWSPAILNRLPHPALACAQANLHSLHTAYTHVYTWCKSVCPHLAPLLSSQEDFFWAWYAVNSRCVYMEVPHSSFIQDVQKNYALVPFLDLLNHSPQTQVSAKFNKVKKSFELVTENSFPRYGQVFIKYGCHSNTELVVEYGFTIPQNPYNVYEFLLDDILTVAKKLNVTCLEQKEKILCSNQFDTGLTCVDDEIFFSWKLLAVVHILLLPWPQIQNWKSSISTVSLSCVCREKNLLAMTLIQFAIEKLQRQQSQTDQSICDNHSALHYELCMTLWQDNFTILEKAQEILTPL